MIKTVIRLVSVILPVIMLILLCGCSVFELSPVEELLRAPKLTGENAAIQQVFEDAVGEKVSLVTPLLGEYRSAYVFFDYDRDEVDEAVVFYTKAGFPDEVHMHLLDKTGENWLSVCDITGNGSEVQKIQFANLDKETDFEFAVTWTVSDSKRTKTLSVYKYKRDTDGIGTLKQITALQLQDYLILDLDLDGANEVLYSFSDISSENLSYDTAVFRIDTASLTPVPLCEISLSKNIDAILNYSYDKTAGACTVYIDCLSADGRYFTEILAYDYEKAALFRPQDENGSYLCTKTYRNDALYSEDYNGDYLIEIPSQSEAEDCYYLNASDETEGKLPITSFYGYQQGEFKCLERFFYNHNDNYRIKLDGYLDTMYIVYSAADRTTRFRLKGETTEDNLLFTVKWDEAETEGEERPEADIVVTKLGREKDISAQDVKKRLEAL